MERFLERHRGRVIGVLSGPDRVLFRGILRSICYCDGMDRFLSSQRVLYKDFRPFAKRLSDGLKVQAERIARQAGRPFEYLRSSRISKEDRARCIMERDHISEGLICVLSCVEPCRTFRIRGDRRTERLKLIMEESKCLHVYFYLLDREFGLMHIRLQTWLPFDIQVCVNGREWLARQLDRAGVGYQREENCFLRIDDLRVAQRIMDRWAQRRWWRWLNVLARRVNPWLNRAARPGLYPYYWTIREDEYATDVMFTNPAALRELYPRLAHQAIEQFSSQDVLRFLGRRTDRRFSGQVSSNLRRRPEGLRVKHWVEENSIKMYDKQGCVLRIETTINNPKRFRIRRETTRQGQRQKRWAPLRKGLADMPRRMEVARAANERYLEALAVVGLPSPAAQLLDPVSRPRKLGSHSYRALRPITPADARVFQTLMRGEFLVQGFRNKDLRWYLLPALANREARRKASAKISRLLRLLRAHHLIRKISGTRYYRVTPTGQHVMSTALKVRQTDVERLVA